MESTVTSHESRVTTLIIITSVRHDESCCCESRFFMYNSFFRCLLRRAAAAGTRSSVGIATKVSTAQLQICCQPSYFCRCQCFRNEAYVKKRLSCSHDGPARRVRSWPHRRRGDGAAQRIQEQFRGRQMVQTSSRHGIHVSHIFNRYPWLQGETFDSVFVPITFKQGARACHQRAHQPAPL
jgi:hypothetical protein